jgi:hypothetical protein
MEKLLNKMAAEAGIGLLTGSVRSFGATALGLGAAPSGAKLLCCAARQRRCFHAFADFEIRASRDGFFLTAPLTGANAAVIRRLFPRHAAASLRAGGRLVEVDAFPPADASAPVLFRRFSAAAAKVVIDAFTWRAFEDNYGGNYALECADDGTLDPAALPWLGRLRLTLPETGDSAVGVDPALEKEYVGATFVLAQTGVVYDRGLLLDCAACCGGILRRVEELDRTLRSCRKLDYELVVTASGASPNAAARWLFLARELRRRRIEQLSFELPAVLTPTAAAELAAAAGYGDFGLVLAGEVPPGLDAGRRICRIEIRG